MNAIFSRRRYSREEKKHACTFLSAAMFSRKSESDERERTGT